MSPLVYICHNKCILIAFSPCWLSVGEEKGPTSPCEERYTADAVAFSINPPNWHHNVSKGLSWMSHWRANTRQIKSPPPLSPLAVVAAGYNVWTGVAGCRWWIIVLSSRFCVEKKVTPKKTLFSRTWIWRTTLDVHEYNPGHPAGGDT